MSRTPSQLTIVIRNLVDDNNSITYKSARPILVQQGFDLVDEPVKTKEYLEWEEAVSKSFKFPKNSEDFSEFYKETFKSLKMNDENINKSIMQIDETWRRFKSERNHFDVTKSNYLKSLTPSFKPDRAENRNAVAHSKSEPDLVEVIQVLIKNGGVKGVQSIIGDLMKQQREIEEKLAFYHELLTKSQDVAKLTAA